MRRLQEKEQQHVEMIARQREKELRLIRSIEMKKKKTMEKAERKISLLKRRQADRERQKQRAEQERKQCEKERMRVKAEVGLLHICVVSL